MTAGIVATAVTTTAAQIALARSNRKKLTIRNLGPDTLYLLPTAGGLAANGFPVKSGEVAVVEGLEAKDPVWGITASGNADVRSWEGSAFRLTGAPPDPTPNGLETLNFAFAAGNQTTGTKKGGILVGSAGTIVDVRAYWDTAPTGATGIIDVNKNGTTIFTTQANRPTAAIGANPSSTTAPDVTAVAAGDRLTYDVDQIGSTVAGADLYVSITIKRTTVA